MTGWSGDLYQALKAYVWPRTAAGAQTPESCLLTSFRSPSGDTRHGEALCEAPCVRVRSACPGERVLAVAAKLPAVGRRIRR